MGYSLSLLAIQCTEPDIALTSLDIVRAGQFCEYARKPLSGFMLPSGWYLIVASRCDSRCIQSNVLSGLSKNVSVVACSIEEHVMFSSAEQWHEGNMLWRAEHAGENGPVNLKTSGTLPPNFQTIFDDIAALQIADGGEKAGVDYYFDIPLIAAKEIIGFKHDEEITGVDYDKFELLCPSSMPMEEKPWWHFWK